jgi:predicted AAA+ superfamily ATPase
LANIADLAGPFQMSRPTIRDYVTLLERVFLVDTLPPRHTNRLSRLVKSPKLHIGDTGIACALLGPELALHRPPARQTKLCRATFPIIAGSPSGRVVTNEIVQKALETD